MIKVLGIVMFCISAIILHADVYLRALLEIVRPELNFRANQTFLARFAQSKKSFILVIK